MHHRHYFADGVLVSDYYALVPPRVFDVARGYARARYAVGLPFVPIGRGLVRLDWIFEVLSWAGVSEAVQKELFPLTLPIMFATGVVNTAYEHLGGVVAFGVVVATVAVGRRGSA